MRKSIFVSLFLVFVLCLTVQVQAKTELVLWFHSGQAAERAVIEHQVKTFNEMNQDIVVKAVEIPEGSYNQQVQAAALAGDLPDILDLDGPFMANYAWSGYLLPLTPYISPEMKDDFLPSILAQGEYNGEIYALGTFDSGLAIWGNKQYLTDIGARIPSSVDDAWTFDEFNTILANLKEHPDVKFPLDLKINYGRGEWFTYGFSPIFQAFGADLIDRETMKSAEGILNGKEAVAAGTWFQELFTKGYVNPNPAGDNEFVNGDAALSWVGHWAWPQYSAEIGEDLVLLPMPKFPGGQATGMGSWAWGIPSNCANPDAAWRYLEFILQPEEIVRMSDAGGMVPARLSAVPLSKAYQEGGPLNLLVEQLKTIAVPRPVTPAYPAITGYFADAIDNIISGSDVQWELDQAVQFIDEEVGYLGL